MLIFIVRRILQLPLVLFGVSILIFGVTQFLAPDVRAASYITSEKQLSQLPAIIERYGLDKSVFVQYGNWLGNVFQGNLGWSASARVPVAEALANRLPATLELTFFAIIPIVFFGVLAGMISGVQRNKWPDQINRVLAIFSFSLPSFVVGITLIAVFYGTLKINGNPFLPIGRANDLFLLVNDYPSSGFLIFKALFTGNWEVFGHLMLRLVLPIVTLMVVLTGALMRVVRSSMIDQLEQDYVRTAKAKGLAAQRITFKHVLRNALIPVITLVGGLLYNLVSGVTITETVFNYPGVGAFAGQAAVQVDIPGVLGFALFAALSITLINLVVDILYGVVDPRIRYD